MKFSVWVDTETRKAQAIFGSDPDVNPNDGQELIRITGLRQFRMRFSGQTEYADKKTRATVQSAISGSYPRTKNTIQITGLAY